MAIKTHTIKAYLSGVSFFFKPITGSSITSLLKDSYIKSKLKALAVFLLLSTCCLHTICSGYRNPQVARTLEAMFLLAFFGFLGRSEFNTWIQFTTESFWNLANFLQFRKSQTIKMTDPPFISESRLVATRFWFHHHFCHVLSLFGILPVNYSRYSFRIEAATSAPIMASQNTSYNSWVAGYPKRITATSIWISKISDLHNLISSDWRFLGVRSCLGVAADSLQSFPTMHSKNSMNQRFVFFFFHDKSFKRILLKVWSLLVNWSLSGKVSGVGPHLNSANFRYFYKKTPDPLLFFALVFCAPPPDPIAFSLFLLFYPLLRRTMRGSIVAWVHILYRASSQRTQRTRRTNVLFYFSFVINRLNVFCWRCVPC